MPTPPGPRRQRPRPYHRSGVHRLKRAVVTLGSRALPSRKTALGRALYDWRAALVADLGGADAISTQQLALVDLAVRSKLLVDSVDAYVLTMPSPVNKRRRQLFAVVMQRQQLADSLARTLERLGLERRAQELPTLDRYLATKATPTNGTATAGSQPDA